MEQRQIDGAYFSLVGGIIAQALYDYQNLRFITNGETKQVRKMAWEDAKRFIFTNQLDTFLEFYHIQEIVSADAVRKSGNLPRNREIRPR